MPRGQSPLSCNAPNPKQYFLPAALRRKRLRTAHSGFEARRCANEEKMRRQQGVLQRTGSKRWFALDPAETVFVALSAPAPLQRSPDYVCALGSAGAGPRGWPVPPFRLLRRFEMARFVFMLSCLPEQPRGGGWRCPSDLCATSEMTRVYVCASLSCRSKTAGIAVSPFRPLRCFEMAYFVFVLLVPPDQRREGGLHCPSGPCAVSRRPGLCLCPSRATPRRRSSSPFRPLRRFKDNPSLFLRLLSCRSNPAEVTCAAFPAPASLQR